MRPKISIIIPVYEAEKYIARTLRSILDQCFTDFELILINDGSTDRSEEIIRECSVHDNRVKLFSQKNAGVSEARNRGIKESIGEFLVFIDADDYIDEQYLESFFSEDACLKGALVLQGYRRTFRGGVVGTFEPKNQMYHSKDFSKLFLDVELVSKTPFPFAKLFDADLINENGIRFKPEIRFGEDLIFLLEYILTIDRCLLVDKIHYHYQYSEGSLSLKINSYESEILRFNLVRDLLKKIYSKDDFGFDTIKYNNSYICRSLIRAIKSLYVGSNQYPTKFRLGILNMHASNEDYFLIKEGFQPLSVSEVVFKHLFLAKLIRIVDSYLILFSVLRKLKLTLRR